MDIQTIIKIDKMEVKNLKFKKEDVLLTSEGKEDRWRELNKGMALGNLHKETTRMVFETENGEMYETEASIWAVTEKNVLLKNGIFIPIRSIHKVIV